DRLADDVEEPAERRLADRDGDGTAGRDRVHPAAKPVGRRHRDGAHPVVAKVLLDLSDHIGAVLALHLKRVVDLGQVAFLELDVEDRTDDLHDLAGVLRCLLLGCVLRGNGHVSYPLPRASAPEAISSISLVMRDWRALFAASVRSSMRSPAASVALRMATICAEKADALDSRMV